MKLKRVFDIVCSSIGLVILSPLFIITALLIKQESRGPVYFRQERIGLHGKIFRIHKFRTMFANSEYKGLQITVGKDKRITRVGAVLRKYKLDELAQLIDVFIGTMSFVGPRPEVPKYIAYYPELIRDKIFSIRPGITDWASIRFKDENSILERSPDPENTYIADILPKKISYYVEYVDNQSFGEDLKIILTTLGSIFTSRDSLPE